MRTIAAVTIAMMMASAASASEHNYFSDSATYACVSATKAAESYISALSSTNRGIVESTLAHVAMIKLTMPGCEMRSVEARVAAIESKGVTEEVRYQTWVVRTLMDKCPTEEVPRRLRTYSPSLLASI